MDEQQPTDQQICDKIRYQGAFAETVANGKLIDWQYWMSMPNLSAAQASHLMTGLDPDIFENLSLNGPTNSDTSGLRHKTRRIERLATGNGWHNATAKDWLAWAKSQGIGDIHPIFVLQTMDKKAKTKKAEMSLLSENRCQELATMRELKFRHWEELTSVGIGEDQSYQYVESGIYPVRHEKHVLQLLSRDERLTTLERSDSAPLLFPCTPKQLVQFIDGGLLNDFKLPAEFRSAVKQLATLVVDEVLPEQRRAPEKKPASGFVDPNASNADLAGKQLSNDASGEGSLSPCRPIPFIPTGDPVGVPVIEDNETEAITSGEHPCLIDQIESNDGTQAKAGEWTEAELLYLSNNHARMKSSGHKSPTCKLANQHKITARRVRQLLAKAKAIKLKTSSALCSVAGQLDAASKKPRKPYSK